MSVGLSGVSLNAYVCRYCGQPDPGEWGVGRRCPEHPRKGEFPAYMQECEFCPIPAVERDAAVKVVRDLQTNLADVRDTADSARDLAQAALDGSHNWLVANWRDESGSSIAGFIPEAEESPDA